ncbi:MAG: septum formation initiator family protein [Bacilli bacterium]|nr:septum formation initiator family protein [Bacilli bacterium]
MERRKSKKEKRRIFMISFLVIALSAFLVKSVFSDWIQILNNNKQIHVLNEQKKVLLEEEASLRAESTKLENPEYVARYAREKYLYSAPDEIIIRVN